MVAGPVINSAMAFFSDEHKAKVTDALVSGDLARTTAKIFDECDANKTTFLELSHGEIRIFIVQIFAFLGLNAPNEALIYDVYKRFDSQGRGALDFQECLQLVVLLSNVVLGIQKPLKGMLQGDECYRSPADGRISRSRASARWSNYPPASGGYPPAIGTRNSQGRSPSPKGSALRSPSPRTLGNPTGAPLEERPARSSRSIGSFMRTPSPKTLANPGSFLPRPASPSRLAQHLSSVGGNLRNQTKPSSSNSDAHSNDATPASSTTLPGSTPGSSLSGPVRTLRMGGEAEWTVDNVIKLGHFPTGPFASKVRILSRRDVNSVQAAVDMLNNGSTEDTEDFCVAFSEVANCYFLLCKRGKESEAWEGLDMQRPPVC